MDVSLGTYAGRKRSLIEAHLHRICDVKELALCGLYRNRRDKDEILRVRCFWCPATFLFSQDIDVWNEHSTMVKFPHCIHLASYKGVVVLQKDDGVGKEVSEIIFSFLENIPNAVQGHRALFDFCTLSGLRYEVCRSPDKASPDIRKETFKTSDLDRTLVQSLVDAGFYFDDSRKRAQCYYCGLCLVLPYIIRCTDHQNVFVQHIIFNRCCLYIVFLVGEERILQVIQEERRNCGRNVRYEPPYMTLHCPNNKYLRKRSAYSQRRY